MVTRRHNRDSQGGVTGSTRRRRSDHKVIGRGNSRGSAQAPVSSNGKPGRAADLGIGNRIGIRVNRATCDGLARVGNVLCRIWLDERRRIEGRRSVRPMRPMACARLIIIMTNHTGSIGCAISAVDNGISNRIPQGQALCICLGGQVIIMAQGTRIASGTAVQFIDIILTQQAAGAGGTKHAGITGVTSRACHAAAKRNTPEVMIAGLGINGLMIGQILPVADDAVTTAIGAAKGAAVFPCRRTDKPAISIMAAGAGVMNPRIVRIDRTPCCGMAAGTVVVLVHPDHGGMIHRSMMIDKVPMTSFAVIGGGA